MPKTPEELFAEAPLRSRVYFAFRARDQSRHLANVGADKDSDKRQRAAIEGFAKRVGFVIVDEFDDAAVSGADPIESRPGFAALLDKIEGNGCRIVIVEDASRFARELVTQELGILALIRGRARYDKVLPGNQRHAGSRMRPGL